MKKIYKYIIEEEGDLLIKAPIEKWLTVQLQRGELVVWAIVDFEKPEKEYYLYVLGTGWPCRRIPGEYVGTVQEGDYVSHVFAARVSRSQDYVSGEAQERFYVS